MFSLYDINKIYNEKVRLPDTYFHKYEVLPPCPVKSFNYNWGGTDFPRNWCILDFIEVMKKHNIESNHLGYTCDSDPELEFISHSKKTFIPYPHPQHMKVVTHLVYVWSGCGNHSMWVWSLNHCTRASFSAKQ